MVDGFFIKSFECNESHYDEIRKQRRDLTFPTFTNRTDEKNHTIKITANFLDDFLPRLIVNASITVNDWGVGDGSLSSMLASYFVNSTYNEISYEGLDRSIEFVNSTKSKLLTLGLKNYTDPRMQNIILGRFESDDIEKLVKHPTLLVASQIIFYAPDISEFVERIIKQMGGVAIVIGQATGSFLNKIGKHYDNSTKQTDTEEPLKESLASYTKFNDVKVLYSSVISFPERANAYNYLKEIAYRDFVLLTEDDLHTRCLLEFVAGSPMERLICLDRIDKFLEDVVKHLSINGGNISFWNYMSIIVPKDKINEEEMIEKWRHIQKLQLSGNVTSFESAIKEGNYEISLSIVNQGMVACILHDYEKNHLLNLWNKFVSWIKYEIRLLDYWYIFINYRYFDIDEQFLFRNYTSSSIQRMQSIKYNFALPEHIINKLDRETFTVISRGFNYTDQLTNKIIHNEYIYSFVLLSIPLIIKDISVAGKMALSLMIMYRNIYEKFIFATYDPINEMNSESLIFQLFLFDKNNLNRLKFQNSIGQTPLHLAIANYDTEKAYKLLCCNTSLVKEILSIVDDSGRLPIHYAAEYNNVKILKMLIEQGSTLDVESYNMLKNIFKGFLRVCR